MKKKSLRIISILLSISVFVTVFCGLQVSAYSTNTEQTILKNGITWEDVAAGLATPYDLYGEIEPETVPAAVGVETAHERLHIERLYTEEEDSLNNVIFKNADGTNTMYLFDYPIKYVDNFGRINDISLEIAPDITNPGHFKNVAHSVQTTFSQNAAEGIKLSYDSVSITLIPLGAAATASGAIALQSTAAQVDNKTVAYAYNDKTSLEYSLTYGGFKEDIVVKEYTGQTEYHFTLLTGGLILKKIGETFCLTDRFNNIRATIGDIIIFTADEKNNTFGRLTFETVKAMQEYRMTIHVDGDYLRDENTTYPIRIDPTIEVKYSNNGAGAIHDVTLNSNYESDTNSASVFIGRRSSTYGISRLLMKFPGLNLSSIPSAAAITSATVEIRDLMCETSAINVSCYAFTGNSWDENTVRWSNVDANNLGELLSSHSISYSNGAQQTTSHRYAFNITAAVKGWKVGNYSQNKGIIFKASSSVENGSSTNYKTIAAYNRTSYRPSMSVTYTTTTSAGTLDFNDVYYINNLYTGQYAYRGDGDTNVHGERGRISTINDRCMWRIDRIDGAYIIRNSLDLTQYLGVLETEGYTGARRIPVTNSTIPESCKWNITLATGGGCIIQNKYSSKYLYATEGHVYTSPTLGSSSNYVQYSSRAWRIINTDDLVTETELKPSTQFYDRHKLVGKTDAVKYRISYSNAVWTEKTDFTYSGYDSNVVSIDYTGKITFIKNGETEVSVMHKPTALRFTFKVYIYNANKNLGTITTWRDTEKNIVGHWPIGGEPEKIYIKKLGTSDYSKITSACQYALDTWNQALSMDMEMTSNENDADIVITVGTFNEIKDTNDFNDLSLANGGITYFSYQCDGNYYMLGDDVRLSAVMTFAKMCLIVDDTYTIEYYKNVAVHELAHALGFFGHSANSTDATYYLLNSVYTLSSYEKAHLKQVYDLR